MELKLPLPRRASPYFRLWLNRIARYTQSLKVENLGYLCDPDINIFCGKGSKLIMKFKPFSGVRQARYKKKSPRNLCAGSLRFISITNEITHLLIFYVCNKYGVNHNKDRFNQLRTTSFENLTLPSLMTERLMVRPVGLATLRPLKS